jgi:hypothetical protein
LKFDGQLETWLKKSKTKNQTKKDGLKFILSMRQNFIIASLIFWLMIYVIEMPKKMKRKKGENDLIRCPYNGS